MNLDATYRTILFRPCVSACRNATASELAVILESSKRPLALNKDITLTQQRVGSGPGLLAGVCRFLGPATSTKPWVIAVVCPLGSKICTFKKIVFLCRTHGSRFTKKICNTFRKICQLLKIITGRKASGSIMDTETTSRNHKNEVTYIWGGM
jgi:hypothetical protein